MTLSGRPVLSKIRVIASGDSSALVGRSAVLGAGTNVSFATCSHCLLVAVGCSPGCASAALFYPRSGTATFTALASQPGQTFQGTFDNVELEQVVIDPVSLVSTPVPGGACFRIRNMTFTASMQSAGSVGTNADDAGTGGGTGNSEATPEATAAATAAAAAAAAAAPPRKRPTSDRVASLFSSAGILAPCPRS